MGTALFALGVTGLWRLTERIEAIRRYPVVIAVVGMEGALFNVLGRLVGTPRIAVPPSAGLGCPPAGT